MCAVIWEGFNKIDSQNNDFRFKISNKQLHQFFKAEDVCIHIKH